MATTKIEWTDYTWNVLRGCTRVSEGCRHCYAERQAIRFAGPGQPYEGLVRSTPRGPTWTGDVALDDAKLIEPLRWRKPRTVFVNSMSDLFHESVPDDFIDKVFAVMGMTPQHTYQVLTKRPERMRTYFEGPDRPNRHERVEGVLRQLVGEHGTRQMQIELSRRDNSWSGALRDWPLRNVWLGVSVEDQASANERIPRLLHTPAAVRFISAEPLLGPIELRCLWAGDTLIDALTGVHGTVGVGPIGPNLPRLDWVIAGGESGPGAMPMHPDWVRKVRDDCVASGVPFFFKQWGAWEPAGWVHAGTRFDKRHKTFNGRGEIVFDRSGLTSANNFTMRRVGKRAAGRLLDGHTWDQMPGVRV